MLSWPGVVKKDPEALNSMTSCDGTIRVLLSTHLTHTGSLKDCFKAVDKSNRLKRVVLNEIQPSLRDLIFDAFKQVLKAPCVRKVSF